MYIYSIHGENYMTGKIEQFTFDDIPPSKYSIENFIITDGNDAPDISLGDPFIFEGIVFVVCLRGRAEVRINFRKYQVTENSIITIVPNQIVEIIACSEDFLIENLAFSPDYLIDMALPIDYDLPGRIISEPVLHLSKEEKEHIFKYHTFILSAFNTQRHVFFKQVIKGLLFSLMMELASKYIDIDQISDKNKVSGRSEEIVKQFFLLLKDNHRQERTSSYYADKLCITSKYLSETLKKVTGRSINSWLEDAILLSSKLLLKSSDLTVLQISEELNFPNPSYFGRFFKKLTGMTPKEYRDKK